MTQEERIRVNQAARVARVVHTGHTIDADGTKTQYVVDNVDCLPPDIRNYNRGYLDCAGTQLVAAVQTTEREGFAVCLQVGDIYYETSVASSSV